MATSGQPLPSTLGMLRSAAGIMLWHQFFFFCFTFS
jgi:hypothetical protein